MFVLRVFDSHGGTLPVEIQEGVDYAATAEADVEPDLFALFTPGAMLLDDGVVRWTGRGREGVLGALCRMVRDLSLDGRFDMWLNDGFLNHHEQQQLEFLAVQNAVLTDARNKVERAMDAGEDLPATEMELARSVIGDMIATVSRLDAITMAQGISRVLRGVIEAVEERSLDVDTVLDDPLMVDSGFTAKGSPRTVGVFIEEFCYRLSRRTNLGAPGSLLRVKVQPVSDLVDEE